MFSVDELNEVVASSVFRADYAHVSQALADLRLEQPLLVDGSFHDRLSHFVEAVLASAPQWGRGAGGELCRRAAEIAELLGSHNGANGTSRRMHFRAGLLYELAGLPAVASALMAEHTLPAVVDNFVRRRGLFGSLVQ